MTTQQTEPTAGTDEPANEELFARLAALDQDDDRRKAVRDELVSRHLRLATNLARKFDRRGEPLDDLVQVATVGLINAVDRFDADRGAAFLPFAVPTIMGELRRHFRDSSWSVRVPRRLKELSASVIGARNELTQSLGRTPKPSELAEHLGISREEVFEALVASGGRQGSSLDRLLEDSPNAPLGSADPEMDEVDNRRLLHPLLAKLPERDRKIVVLRFFGGMSQADIARRVGVSQMQVSRLLASILSRLRAGIGDVEGGGE
ncbi:MULTISPECIES: SigB/SigF/SigG family RNA polymerase sigma factor [Actinoalloteichus]|uniref:RNA polymerase sigma-70 factor, sigma-B/F/G subfamily n=1 Tax=Actinoalloteichus fjordicus TaxID=1612552 RepID=A0AAC9LH02_9PSEU|nr:MULTISPECIES: SigB/SigF/SigG family RNA polymerase sigma factor [Actinoalloteichus]APU16704.1 RNA polymerase sigma-70 factor, sigma-B/F/G subfamily [Actinoalloteichus fjordicus]APU22770.1 RNA polymerase sigma-70 factor, sigma-B/F/G subfamily [Actinoalloteichus sp. GBA129-24]